MLGFSFPFSYISHAFSIYYRFLLSFIMFVPVISEPTRKNAYNNIDFDDYFASLKLFSTVPSEFFFHSSGMSLL